MWFLIIRPQRRRQQAAQQLLMKIDGGKEIVTAGGLYGTVTAVEGDAVRLEIAEGVEARSAQRGELGRIRHRDGAKEPPHREAPRSLATEPARQNDLTT